MVDHGEGTKVDEVNAEEKKSTRVMVQSKEITLNNSDDVENEEEEILPEKVDRSKKAPFKRDNILDESESQEFSEREVSNRTTTKKPLKSAALIRRSDDESDSEPLSSDGSDSDFDLKKASIKKINKKRKNPPIKKVSSAKKATPKGKKPKTHETSDESEASLSDSDSDYGTVKKAKKCSKKKITANKSQTTVREVTRRRSAAINKSFKELSDSGSDQDY